MIVHILTIIFGIIVIAIGFRTVITQEATINIQLWGRGSFNIQPPDATGRGYVTSEQTGFIAILIGIAQIVMGLVMIFKGPGFFS